MLREDLITLHICLKETAAKWGLVSFLRWQVIGFEEMASSSLPWRRFGLGIWKNFFMEREDRLLPGEAVSHHPRRYLTDWWMQH